MFLPHEIDPETIHVTLDYPVQETLEGAAQLAGMTARTYKKYVMVNYDDETSSLKIKSSDPEMFHKGFFQCPRDADAHTEPLTGPRPTPSILACPDGSVVVSKPSLCDSCIWRLQRAVKGNCHGNRFELL